MSTPIDMPSVGEDDQGDVLEAEICDVCGSLLADHDDEQHARWVDQGYEHDRG